MHRILPALLLFSLLLLAGCAGTSDPRERAAELMPGREVSVMTPGTRWFAFTLASPAQVVLESRTFPGDHFVSTAGELFDSRGGVVAQDRNSGIGNNFRIRHSLEAGTWYLRVTTPFAPPAGHGLMERDYRYSVLMEIEG